MNFPIQAAIMVARNKKARKLFLALFGATALSLLMVVVILVVSVGAVASMCQDAAQERSSSSESPSSDTPSAPGSTPPGYVWTKPSQKAIADIPKNYLPAYQDAAKKYGIDWTVLAAIGFVETGHGEGGKEEDCIGSPAGAQGPMEFMPDVWASLGIDGNGDGKKDVCNYQDAIYSAAKYLRDSGAPQDYHQAIFAYNHAEWYVQKVLAKAQEYRAASPRGSSQGSSGVSGASGVPYKSGGSGTAPQGWDLVDQNRRVDYELHTRYVKNFQEAAAAWNAADGVKIEPTPSPSQTDLVVSDGSPPGGLMGLTSSDGTMTMDQTLMSLATDNARTAAFAHELGHAEGFDHTEQDSVMNTPIITNSDQNNAAPTGYDVSLARQSWGEAPSGSSGNPSSAPSGQGSGTRVEGNARAVFPLPREYFDSYDDTWGASRSGGNTHEGTDMFAPEKTPIYSITDGKVVLAAGSNDQGWNELGGWTTMIEATEDLGPIKVGDRLYYAHQIEPTPMKVGQTVKAGDIIGHVGSTGEGPPGTLLQPASRGKHLHLGWYDSSGARAQAASGAMNPYPLLQWLKQNGGTATGTTPLTSSPDGTSTASMPIYCLAFKGTSILGHIANFFTGGGKDSSSAPQESAPLGKRSAQDLLENPNVSINPPEVGALKAGKIDPRLIAVLQMVSKKHKIYVSAFIDDGVGATLPGTNIPNSHYYGRAADIAKIDGMPVTGNGTNPAVLDVGRMTHAVPAQERPDEIIGPPEWISTLGYPREEGYIDDPSLTSVHRDHLHIGFSKAPARITSNERSTPHADDLRRSARCVGRMPSKGAPTARLPVFSMPEPPCRRLRREHLRSDARSAARVGAAAECRSGAALARTRRTDFGWFEGSPEGKSAAACSLHPSRRSPRVPQTQKPQTKDRRTSEPQTEPQGRGLRAARTLRRPPGLLPAPSDRALRQREDRLPRTVRGVPPQRPPKKAARRSAPRAANRSEPHKRRGPRPPTGRPRAFSAPPSYARSLGGGVGKGRSGRTIEEDATTETTFRLACRIHAQRTRGGSLSSPILSSRHRAFGTHGGDSRLHKEFAMSLRIGGSGEDQRRRRRRIAIVTALSVTFILFWVGAVLWLGPGSGGQADRNGGANGKPSTNVAQETSTERTSARARQQARSTAQGEGSVLRSEKPGQTDHVTPKDPEKFRIAEQKRDKLATGEPTVPAGGATNEPAGLDPLGIKRKEIPLTPADVSRVRDAAAKFVASAYGYSGKKGTRKEYLSGVNDAVLAPEFYSSAGAKEVSRYATDVNDKGTKSAAKMTRWVIKDASQSKVEGFVYFETGDGYDRYGELTGEKKTYRQDLTVVRYGAAFKVKAAGPIQEVRVK